MSKNPSDPNQIIPGLYLSDYRASQSEEILDKHGITSILNMTTKFPNFFEADPLQKDKFSYVQYKIKDEAEVDLYPYFESGTTHIENVLGKGEVIMVHCEAGISRSASMVIAYLIRCKKMALIDAYALVKSERKQICPNHGFFSLLLKWEKANLGVNSCTFEYGLCQFLREIVPGITEEKVRESLKLVGGNVEQAVANIVTKHFEEVELDMHFEN